MTTRKGLLWIALAGLLLPVSGCARHEIERADSMTQHKRNFAKADYRDDQIKQREDRREEARDRPIPRL